MHVRTLILFHEYVTVRVGNKHFSFFRGRSLEGADLTRRRLPIQKTGLGTSGLLVEYPQQWDLIIHGHVLRRKPLLFEGQTANYKEQLT